MGPRHRSAARLAAVQALYQMDVAGKGVNEILAEFESHWIGGEIEGEQYEEADVGLFRDIVKGVLADQLAIDRETDATLQQGWPLRRVEAVMRAVLRAGAYELRGRADVPAVSSSRNTSTSPPLSRRRRSGHDQCGSRQARAQDQGAGIRAARVRFCSRKGDAP